MIYYSPQDNIPPDVILNATEWHIVYPDGRVAECKNYKAARAFALKFQCTLRPQTEQG
jgi:hypothetical protein